MLNDDELRWTERFVGGVFCFRNGQLGISFKNAQRGIFVEVDNSLTIPVKRKYCGASPEVHKDVRDITCLIPAAPGTFLPLDAPQDQQEVMLHLLKIVEVLEQLLEAESQDEDDARTDALRQELNQAYDTFFQGYGLISNCHSYFNGIWHDIRLEIYLTQIVDAAGNKSDIFHRRLNHPPKKFHGQIFHQEDINERISAAFAWSMSWFGYVNLPEIAEKSGIDEAEALDLLLKAGLAYRDWHGLSQDWWDVLGVDKNIKSMYRLKQAYREKSKEYHPDINKSPGAHKMAQVINDAYAVAKSIVAERCSQVSFHDSSYIITRHPPLDPLTMHVMQCQVFGIWILPKDIKYSELKSNEKFLVLDISKLSQGIFYPIAVFRSEASAIDAVTELESGGSDIGDIIRFCNGRRVN